MTKSSLVLLALAAGAPLLAQAPGLSISNGDSSLTLYGILDAGVANVSHTLDFSSDFVTGVNPTLTKTGKNSATGIMNGGVSQTRWGLKGQLGLGDGWKGVFNLESAINLQSGIVSNSGLQFNTGSGAQVSADTALDGGQLFGRNANVGLSNDTYGTLTIGRHTSLMLDNLAPYDALQGAQQFTPTGFSGSYGGGGATDNSRVDSSLKYRVKIGDVAISGLYKFAGVAGNSTAKNVSEFGITYEPGAFGIAFFYQNAIDMTSVGNPSGTVNGAVLSDTAAQLATVANGTVAYQPIGTVTATAYDTHAIMGLARYKVGDFFFDAGYERESFVNPSDPSVAGAMTSIYSIPLGTWVQGGKIVPAVNVSPYTVGGAQMEKVLNVWWLGARYDFTKRLNLAVSYYHVGQNDYSNGTTSASAKSGTTKYTSALLDYNWTKAFDIYLGYMYTKGDGGMVAGYAYDNQAITGLGLRYKF